MKRHSQRSAAAGFTLLELLVVMGIVGLVAAAAMAARPRSETASLDATARVVAARLRAARSDAMLRSRETAVWFDAATGRYGVAKATQALPRGMRVAITVAAEERRGDQGAVRFYPDGQSSGGEITLNSGTHATRIAVSWLTGAPKVLR